MMNKQAKEEPMPEEIVETAEEKATEESLTETMEKEVEAEEAAKPQTAEEKAEAKQKKKKEEEEDIVEEKTYTIPLGKALIMPPRKRAPRAMHMIRAYIVKHMKVPSRAEEEGEEPPQLVITQEVNERIWGRGIEKPPRKIRVRATKDSEGNVKVHLAEAD
jgi:large subunit ribosomal protein L31e